jgi:hypothetical protein
MNARLVFLNLPAMKANSWWIKTDYWMQTVMGVGILITAASLIGWMFALILLIPFGAWQLLSGLIAALYGDRLQQIYLVVASLILVLCYFNLDVRTETTLLVLIIVSIPIGIWKYTVARADYISLNIIAVADIDHDDLLDA